VAELAKEQRDPRKRPRTEENFPRGRAQGLEAQITTAPPKEKDDELEEVVSLGGTKDEEMPDFGNGDVYGDPSFEGPYNQGGDDCDAEIAEMAGIAYWQVPPTVVLMSWLKNTREVLYFSNSFSQGLSNALGLDVLPQVV